VRGPANRSGRTRRVPPRLQDGPRSGTRNARHGLRSALAGKPQLPQLNSIGFRNSPSGFLWWECGSLKRPMPVVGSDPGESERDRLWRQAHGVIFTTGVTVQQWLPSQRVIKLDCIVVKEIPPCTIAASPERFLTTFLTPKGRNYGPGGNE